GTNLIFYTIIEGTMTHVYSFALITLFLYSLYRFFEEQKGKWFIVASFAFALISLIRPVNGLILLLIPFLYHLVSRYPYKTFQLPTTRHLVTGILIVGFIWSIPFLLWKTHTGQWIVYSYGDEKFNFEAPHFVSILFSFNRGWFIYTPAAFLAFFGFIGLFREKRKAGIWLLLFMITFIYVCSSWWMWYYASKCGQRIFIDILAVVGILLIFLLKSIDFNRVLKRLINTLLIIFILLNLIQTYQHYRWIFPSIDINWEIYKSAFFALHPVSRVNIPEGSVISSSSVANGMEKNMGWMNEGSITSAKAYSGIKSSFINTANPYSIGMDIEIQKRFTSTNRILRITAMVFCNGDKGNGNFVADFSRDGKNLYYKAFYCEPFLVADKWVKIVTAFYIPPDIGEDCSVKLYFFLPPGGASLYIDDMQIDFLSLKEKHEFSKLEGVLNPAEN
ncbi:MAG: 6-pyruvoyl-tetrahydropterin synthase-related protein, partial [Bacteroidota bacterium]